MKPLSNVMARVAGVAAASALAASQAQAALSTDITTAITTTQTDVLALLGALTVAGAAIWVGRMIYNYFRVK